MKLLVIETVSGQIELAKNDEKLGAIYGAKLLGTIEVAEPPNPKQTVTKETTTYLEEWDGVAKRPTGRIVFSDIPFRAKNICCTYEVEE